jgi:hypothetical protein
MESFFSTEAERALMGISEDANRLFAQPFSHQLELLGTPFLDVDNSLWAHAHTSDTGLDYFHPAGPPGDLFLGLGISGPPSSAPTLTFESGSRYSGKSRSPSPHRDLSSYGTLSPTTNTWRCAYPGCSSKALFARPCDLRKHFHRHSKAFFCRYDGCPQSEALATMAEPQPFTAPSSNGGKSIGPSAGFSSQKDRARHEAKHNPGIVCEWDGCDRKFSRRDNMLDHLRRIHGKPYKLQE